jgi:hypothetical protein
MIGADRIGVLGAVGLDADERLDGVVAAVLVGAVTELARADPLALAETSRPVPDAVVPHAVIALSASVAAMIGPMTRRFTVDR